MFLDGTKWNLSSQSLVMQKIRFFPESFRLSEGSSDKIETRTIYVEQFKV